MADYQAKFEALSNKVQGLSKPWLVSFFIARLSNNLKCQLCIAKPVSYPETVALARLHEQNHIALKNSFKNPLPTASGSFPHSRYGPSFSSTNYPFRQPITAPLKPQEPTATIPSSMSTNTPLLKSSLNTSS